MAATNHEDAWARGRLAGLAAWLAATAAACVLALALAACGASGAQWQGPSQDAAESSASTPEGWEAPAGVAAEVLQPNPADLASLPAYDGTAAYVCVGSGVPSLTAADAGEVGSWEYYAPLDSLGRCTVAVACVGSDLFPTTERGNISMVKPSGWRIAKYDFIDGKYLFNRCHLIARMLTGEDANERNLVTGTRYMNTQGMGPVEDEVAAYVRQTGNHVLYRVTPVYVGDEPLARGVRMEALSVEDGGEGVCLDMFAYNVQPEVGLDYVTGDNWLDDDPGAAWARGIAGAGSVGDAATTAPAETEGDAGEGSEAGAAAQEASYVLNTKSRKFHHPWCDAVSEMNPDNRQDYTGARDELVAQGYSPCGTCNP